MEKTPDSGAPGPASPLPDEPFIAVYEAEGEGELSTEVWSSGAVGCVLAAIAIGFAAFGEAVPALVFAAMGVGMWFVFRRAQRMRNSNAKLSYNTSHLIAEKPDQTSTHNLKQLRVINQIKAQDDESKLCIYNIEFRDGTVYWLYGEDEVNTFATELRRVSGAPII